MDHRQPARLYRLLRALSADDLDRQELNAALKTVFRKATVNYPDGTLDLEWTHGGGDCSIPFMAPTAWGAEGTREPSNRPVPKETHAPVRRRLKRRSAPAV